MRAEICTGINPSSLSRGADSIAVAKEDRALALRGKTGLGYTNRENISLRESKMNKHELIATVADSAELSKADASRAVDALIEAVKKGLKKGDTITLVGFGTFSVRKRAARQGRNPQTGATIKIKASKNPAFKAGKALKDAVN